MERKRWWRNLRKLFWVAAAPQDHRTPLKLMRHPESRPRGKHNHLHLMKVLPRNSPRRWIFIIVFFFIFFYHVVKYFSCNMHLELSRYYSVYICGDVCLHICRCNWVCTCTEFCKFAYVCAWENERERGQETKKCVRDGASLFIHIPQTNSLCFSVLHQMHFIFLEHADRNQFWGNGEPGFVCLGQDGTVWSL